MKIVAFSLFATSVLGPAGAELLATSRLNRARSLQEGDFFLQEAWSSMSMSLPLSNAIGEIKRPGGSGVLKGSTAESTATSECDTNGLLSQTISSDIVDLNSFACGQPDGGTTYQKWARCYVLGEEGCSESRTLDSVTFGVERISGDGAVPLKVNVWKDSGCLSGNPGTAGELVASIDTEVSASEVGSLVTVDIDSDVELAPSDAIRVEIEQVLDGADATPSFEFYPGTNDLGQTASGYILALDCGIDSFIDLADIGFTSVHLLLDVQTSPVPTPAPIPTPTGSKSGKGVKGSKVGKVGKSGKTETYVPTNMPSVMPTRELVLGCGDAQTVSTIGLPPFSAPFCGANNWNGGAAVFSFRGTGDYVFFVTCGGDTDIDTQVRVYRADSGQCVSGNDDSSCGLQSVAEFQTEPTVQYDVVVDGYDGAEGTVTLSTTCVNPVDPLDSPIEAIGGEKAIKRSELSDSYAGI